MLSEYNSFSIDCVLLVMKFIKCGLSVIYFVIVKENLKSLKFIMSLSTTFQKKQWRTTLYFFFFLRSLCKFTTLKFYLWNCYHYYCYHYQSGKGKFFIIFPVPFLLIILFQQREKSLWIRIVCMGLYVL